MVPEGGNTPSKQGREVGRRCAPLIWAKISSYRGEERILFGTKVRLLCRKSECCVREFVGRQECGRKEREVAAGPMFHPGKTSQHKLYAEEPCFDPGHTRPGDNIIQDALQFFREGVAAKRKRHRTSSSTHYCTHWCYIFGTIIMYNQHSKACETLFTYWG